MSVRCYQDRGRVRGILKTCHQKNNVAFFLPAHSLSSSPTTSSYTLTLLQLSQWYARYALYISHVANYPQAQTPQQRRANDRFAKTEAAKRGKGPVTVKPKKNTKSPLSATWVGMLDLWKLHEVARIMLIEYQFSSPLSFAVVSFSSSCASSLTSGPPWSHGSARSWAKSRPFVYYNTLFSSCLKYEALAVPILKSQCEGIRAKCMSAWFACSVFFCFCFLNMYDLYCISLLPLKPNTICVARFIRKSREVRSLPFASRGLSSFSSS